MEKNKEFKRDQNRYGEFIVAKVMKKPQSFQPLKPKQVNIHVRKKKKKTFTRDPWNTDVNVRAKSKKLP